MSGHVSGNTGFHDFRSALTSADRLVRNGGKCFFCLMCSHDINQYMVGHQVRVNLEDVGLLSKSGGHHISY